MLPNKPRGVARVNDRRVLNGIFWVLRSGAPWRDLPDSFGSDAAIFLILPTAAALKFASASSDARLRLEKCSAGRQKVAVAKHRTYG